MADTPIRVFQVFSEEELTRALSGEDSSLRPKRRVLATPTVGKRSPSSTTVFLVVAVLLLAMLMLVACVLAAVNDAQAHVLEEQGRHLAAPVLGVEVVQGAVAKAQSVHASHALRQGAVSA